MDSRSDVEEIKKLILEMAEKFIASPEIPEVGIHFARLQSEGHSTDTAKQMIGTVIVTHVSLCRKKGSPIDRPLLRSELARLPKLGSTPGGYRVDIRGIDIE